jgi:integrase
MKIKYRSFRRKSGVYYLESTDGTEQRSLHTRDEAEAKQLVDAENKAHGSHKSLALELGRVYLRHADPKLVSRTWAEAIAELSSHGKQSSRDRSKRAFASKAFDVIRNRTLVETTGDNFKQVLSSGGSATNNYLRRLHNLALGHGWLAAPVIPPKQWDKPKKKPRRGITEDEHNRIIAAEKNEERRDYYQLLWLVGAAQTDGASLTDKNIDWNKKVLSYQRSKTGEWAHLQIGASLEAVLKRLPRTGPLFARISELSDKDRAAEFSRRLRLLGIKGVSLHSYRYGWAERAFAANYPERAAQAALGHKSRAVHHGYARGAVVICPPLETANIISFPVETSPVSDGKSRAA